jgi:hypothetical protein
METFYERWVVSMRVIIPGHELVPARNNCALIAYSMIPRLLKRGWYSMMYMAYRMLWIERYT